MDDGKRSAFERRNPRGTVGDTDDEESDNESIAISISDENIGLIGSTSVDVEFEDELGYGMIVMLRGRTTGRRLKREFCCFTTYQIIVAIALWLIAENEASIQYIVSFFEKTDSSALSWTHAISIMCFIWSSVSVLILRYWSSIVSNRALFSTILKLYVLVFFIKFILVLIALVNVFNTFGTGPRYGTGAGHDANNMLKYYILTVVFMLPYLVCVLLYGMNISFLNEEVEMGGKISEPNSIGAIDMTGITLTECCTSILAYPLAIVYQCVELVYAVYLMGSRGWFFFWRRYEESRQAGAAARAAAAAERSKKGRSLYRRLSKTFYRLLRMVPGFGPKYEVDRNFIAPLPQSLRNIGAVDREQAERLEQERIAEEANRRSTFDKQRREKEAANEKAKKIAAEEAAIAAKRLLELQAEEELINANLLKPTLTSEKFKEMWGSLAQAGSFQCKLKSMPDVKTFAAHLTKQDFYVVFAAGSSANGDVEIGLCNIRASNEEQWFLARLLASNGTFSAVMKSQSPDIVPKFVKKFALAKILKIDTTKK